MSTEQGVNNRIPLPAELQAAEELARNRVSLLDQDTRRLTRFKQELEVGCASLKQDEEDRTKRINDLKKEESDIEQRIITLKQREIDAGQAADKAVEGRKAAEKEEDEVKTRVDALKLTEGSLKTKIETREADLAALDAKKEKRVQAVTDTVAVLENLKTQL